MAGGWQGCSKHLLKRWYSEDLYIYIYGPGSQPPPPCQGHGLVDNMRGTFPSPPVGSGGCGGATSVTASTAGYGV